MEKRDRFGAARRAVPLPQLWQEYAKPIGKHADGTRFTTAFTPCCGAASTRDDAGSLFITSAGEWRYKCFRCSGGGSAVDFVAAMEHITDTAACQRLLERGGGFQTIMGREPDPPRRRVVSADKAAAVGRVIAVIRTCERVDPQVRKYLAGRGIPDAVVDEAHGRGLLRTLPANHDAADVWLRLKVEPEDLRVSGLLRVGGRRAAAAYRPLAFLAAGNSAVEFRAIEPTTGDAPKALQYGSNAWPLAWKPRGAVATVLVVEGGIDLLSAVALGFGQDTLILGLLGAAAWSEDRIAAIREKYPHARWQIGLDGDHAGCAASDKLLAVLSGMGATAERVTPWGGGSDWNDTLIAARAF